MDENCKLDFHVVNMQFTFITRTTITVYIFKVLDRDYVILHPIQSNLSIILPLRQEKGGHWSKIIQSVNQSNLKLLIKNELKGPYRGRGFKLLLCMYIIKV